MKSVVLFYTWSGQTKKMAEIIAKKTGADMLEIKPRTRYPQAYDAAVKQAKDEIQRGFLPEINNTDCDLSRYDIIYTGTPIWCGTMAPPLASFLNSHDFSGKIVMPFSSHGGGGKGHSDRDITSLCAGAEVKEMFAAYEGGGNKAEKEISRWIADNIE